MQVFCFALFFYSSLLFAAQNVRKVSLSENDIQEVKTALGFSTYLEFDSQPKNAILGDQDSFKVEYVGQGLTIKPLQKRGSTNLIVFTEGAKFKFRLSVISSEFADFSLRVVRRRKGTVKESEAVLAQAQKDGITLKVTAIQGKSKSRAVYIGLKNLTNRPLRFSPLDFSLVQGGQTIPFRTVFLSHNLVRPGEELRGTLVIENPQQGGPMTLSLHRPRISLVLPERGEKQ